MSAGSVVRNMLRSIFSWKMLFMLIGSTLVFGGIGYTIQSKFTAMAAQMASMPVPVINVTAIPAEAQDWGVEVAAIGILEARRGVDINSSVPGLVQQIRFESGESVAQGQPLVQLDADVERSNLAKAQAALKLARADLARGETLLSTNNISKATLDQRQSEYDVAAAEVAALAAQIEKKTIFAPFDGELGIRKINVGQYLEAGQAIVNIQDLSIMFVNFSVSQRDLSDLKVGQKIRMTTDAYPVREFEGEISAIEPLVNQQTGMVEVQGRFDNAEGLLRPGMFAKLAVLLPARMDVVVVPQTAISYSLYGDYIYLVKAERTEAGEDVNVVERRIVDTGERRQGFVIIESGVEAGEMVVTSGQLKLDNGTRVAVVKDDTLALPDQVPVE
ncbi:membrane fusion protein (multidrug efflux system) [Dongia mobilis]|uniref:Membrane fusion protein (Multidrug efflux system) n=1 Tax=Dongia mobilis TaxID=578943 RepID=A0A4R6WJG0_9PROT|nr:efflux RND transporter periplasmic adaptor subunit [Dongia mobilis]TDQ78814.1 membrane fusion protein (multidrug efflux system) [Dongia mobilis]